VNTPNTLWEKLRNKQYREQLVAAQVKQGIPFQIRTLMKKMGLSQETLAARSGLSQGVVSRAANPNYGNLTLNTIIRIAAGFDVAFVGLFVPFSNIDKWFTTLSPEAVTVKNFTEEDDELRVAAIPELPVGRENKGLPQAGTIDNAKDQLVQGAMSPPDRPEAPPGPYAAKIVSIDVARPKTAGGYDVAASGPGRFMARQLQSMQSAAFNPSVSSPPRTITVNS
jgi:transcriptional regulator with XRE-family HTH domain